jgi:hypothetical protein
MKMLAVSCLILAILSGPWAYSQDADLLLDRSITLNVAEPADFFNDLQDNLKPFVQNFKIQLDDSSKIVSRKKVLGTDAEPQLQVSIQKCVLVICQVIELDAQFRLIPTEGQCEYSYLLEVDLENSSERLANLYSQMLTEICATRTENGSILNLKVYLIHADSYSAGVIQKTAFALISRQAEAIWKSVISTLKESQF